MLLKHHTHVQIDIMAHAINARGLNDKLIVEQIISAKAAERLLVSCLKAKCACKT